MSPSATSLRASAALFALLLLGSATRPTPPHHSGPGSTSGPIEEVSCGPANVKAAQEMNAKAGRTKVVVEAVYGAMATAGAPHKHQLTLEKGRDYVFILSVYEHATADDGETIADKNSFHYNTSLRVTDTKNGKVLLEKNASKAFRLNTASQLLSVKKTTVVDLDYGYTINGDSDLPNTCLTLQMWSQPKQ